MVANTVQLRDGNGNSVLFKTDYDAASNAHSTVTVSSPGTLASTLTQTTVPLTANTNTQLVANNAARRYLTIQNIGSNTASLGFGANAAVSAGYQLASNGVIEFTSSAFVPSQAVFAYSLTGTTLVVLEG